jgi:hypothetical protein
MLPRVRQVSVDTFYFQEYCFREFLCFVFGGDRPKPKYYVDRVDPPLKRGQR